MNDAERKAAISKLKAHIKRGEEFEAQGYEVDMFQALNRSLLARLESEGETCPAKTE